MISHGAWNISVYVLRDGSRRVGEARRRTRPLFGQRRQDGRAAPCKTTATTPIAAANNHVRLGRSPSTDAADDDRARFDDEAASVDDTDGYR